MMILGSKRDKLLDTLKLSPSMKKLIKGEFVHEELEFRCLELKYSLESVDFSPPRIDLIPLWESDISITGFYINEKKTVFIHYYVDDISDFKIIGTSVLELVDYLVSEYVDFEYEAEVKTLLLGE